MINRIPGHRRLGHQRAAKKRQYLRDVLDRVQYKPPKLQDVYVSLFNWVRPNYQLPSRLNRIRLLERIAHTFVQEGKQDIVEQADAYAQLTAEIKAGSAITLSQSEFVELIAYRELFQSLTRKEQHELMTQHRRRSKLLLNDIGRGLTREFKHYVRLRVSNKVGSLSDAFKQLRNTIHDFYRLLDS